MKKKIVIIGAGFAGLNLAQKLEKKEFSVFLIDKNNYHQFQPLFYQVATAGLEANSIIFPLRKAFQGYKNIHIRMAELVEIVPQENKIITTQEDFYYDYLVIATGATTNFFGNKQIEEHAIPMKSVSEALYLRNRFLENLENAYYADATQKEALKNIVIVGGGPTGVEMAGALAEMRKDVMPKEYKELNYKNIDIHLIQGGETLLKGMSEQAGKAAERYLKDLDVKIKFDVNVTDYDGETVTMSDNTTLKAKKVIWAAGIVGNTVKGLPPESTVRGKRIKVNRINQVTGFTDIFAVGDIAYMEESESEKFKTGHPQVAQVSIQMAKNLGKNLKALSESKSPKDFKYCK